MSSFLQKSNQDVFATINSWPYHLLDSVAASSIRTNATEVQLIISRLIKREPVDSYTVIMAVDNVRRILTWINTNKSGGVMLPDMDKVFSELKKILASLEKVYSEIAHQEHEPRGGDVEGGNE